MSRNGRWPSSSSFSFVNSIFLWSPLRWFRNSVSFSWPWDQMTKVSSTYLNQHTGLCIACSIAFSQNPPWRNLQLQEKMVSPLLPRPFVRRTIHQNRNMWMLVRVWTLPGHHLQSSSESTVGTLVNRDTTSKLTIRSSGCTRRDSNIWMNWKEFFTWCAEFPVSWLSSPAKYLESW